MRYWGPESFVQVSSSKAAQTTWTFVISVAAFLVCFMSSDLNFFSFSSRCASDLNLARGYISSPYLTVLTDVPVSNLVPRISLMSGCRRKTIYLYSTSI